MIKINETKKIQQKKQKKQNIKRCDEKRQKNDNKNTKLKIKFFVILHVNVKNFFTNDSFSSSYFIRSS